ncbi:hypothetical protein [Rubritepida flocculans]|uniref:hypothetical protein n=1 Tax=Rubritepida flocculans TaxID=182403 RepID=UPI00040B0C7C|nr:hypothetical protein [Rubritepida flocculans]
MARLLAPLLFAGLLGLFWSGLFHLHPPLGWVDPGLYIHWFLLAPENAAYRDLDYHGARLTYVLPGFLLYRLFEPVLAQALLVSGFYLLGLLGLHLLSGALLSGVAARAVLLVALGANPLWIGAFARGYVDGPCMALGLLALACLLRPAAPPGPLRHALAGALLVLALCAHALGGGMAALAVAAVALLRAPGWRAVLANGAAGLAGVLAGFLALALAGRALGLPFLFVQAFWTPLRLSVDGTYDGFALPLSAWLPFAPRLLILPLIFALPLLARPVLRAEGRRGLAFLAASLVPLLPLAAWFFRSASLLQFHFYASYLQLALVPALVLFLARVERAGALPGRRGLGLLVLALGLVLGLGALPPLPWRQEAAMGLAVWAVAGAVLAGGLALAAAGRLRPALPAVSLGLMLAGALNADTARAYRFPGAPDQAAHMRALGEFHRFLSRSGGLGGSFLIWMGRDGYTRAHGLGDAFLHDIAFRGSRLRLNFLDTLAATLGWHRLALGFGMPVLEEQWGIAHAANIAGHGLPLITLCALPEQCRAGVAALRELGLAVEEGPVESFALPGVPGFAAGRAVLSNPHRGQAPPLPGQIEAILARLDGLDAAAPPGAPPPSPEARARPDLAGPTPRPIAALEEAGCASEAQRIACRVRYRAGDGRLLTRALSFQPFGAVALLRAAGPAEAAP